MQIDIHFFFQEFSPGLNILRIRQCHNKEKYKSWANIDLTFCQVLDFFMLPNTPVIFHLTLYQMTKFWT